MVQLIWCLQIYQEMRFALILESCNNSYIPVMCIETSTSGDSLLLLRASHFFRNLSELKFFLNKLLVLRSIRRLLPLRTHSFSTLWCSPFRLGRQLPFSYYLSAVIVSKALFSHQRWEHFRGNVNTWNRSVPFASANGLRVHFWNSSECSGDYMRR